MTAPNLTPTPGLPQILTESNPTPPDPSTDNEPVVVAPPAQPTGLPPELLNAYNGLVSEARQDAQRARAELERLQAERSAAPPLSDEDASKEYFKNPIEVIRREIAAAVKPLNESAAKFSRTEQYATLKTQMRADVRFVDLHKFEAEFDRLMQTQPLDPNVMIGTYYAALGYATANGTINNAPASNNPPAAPLVTTPPHLRPSAPAAPVAPTPGMRALSENEEIVRRANNMTVKDYLDGLEGSGRIK